MLKIKNTLEMTGLLFGLCTLFCYISWHLGYEGFILVGHVEMSKWLNQLVASSLLCLDLTLFSCFAMGLYSWKILYFTLPMVLASAIGSISLPTFIFTGFVPLTIHIIYVMCTKQKLKGIIRVLIGHTLIIGYQWMMYTFRGLIFSSHQSIYQALMLSVDNILLTLLFFSLGGVGYYGRMEQMVRSRLLRSTGEDSESLPKDIDDVPVSKFETWAMRSVIGVAQVIQWMFILWVCSLDNLFLDALVITTSAICHGMIIKHKIHLKPIILCSLFATMLYYFAARFTISFHYSQFFPIVVGLGVVIFQYEISRQMTYKIKKELNQDLKRIEALEQRVDNAWKQIDNFYQ